MTFSNGNQAVSSDVASATAHARSEGLRSASINGTATELGRQQVDEALRWLVDALLDGEVEQTIELVNLPEEVQFLGVYFLRCTARAAIAAAGIDQHEFVAATAKTLRRWMLRTDVPVGGN